MNRSIRGCSGSILMVERPIEIDGEVLRLGASGPELGSNPEAHDRHAKVAPSLDAVLRDPGAVHDASEPRHRR